MADTQYKSKTLIGLDPVFPAIGGLAPRTLMRWAPLGALMRAQDTVVATSRRVVAEWSLSGANDWAQPNGTVDPDGGLTTNDYPDVEVWRRIGTYRANVTPGCQLAARVLYCPAGLAQRLDDFDNNPVTPDTYGSAGAGAALRIGTTWTATPGGASSGPHYRICPMEGAPGGTWGGLENSGGGQNWADLRIRDIADIRPPTYTSDTAVAATYSEWSSVEIRLEVQGGARVVHVVVYEQPLVHVQDHDNAGEKSVHAMPASLAPQTPMPLDDPPDGATYDEHRFGMAQLQRVCERQSERLGPRVLHVTSWRESDSTIWDQAEQNPFTTTSATNVDLFETSATSYSRDNPGLIVAGAYAKLHRLCEPRLIMRGGVAAVVPVRVRVDASQSSGTGTVRVQSSPYEWVEVSITGGRAWYTTPGYLESQAYADHSWATVQIFGRCTAGTLSVYNVCVDFGEWTL